MDDSAVQRLACVEIPTDAGRFDLRLYRAPGDDKDHLALVLGKVADRPGVLVRVHSECLTGEVFGSRRCDCELQLRQAMQLIANEGAGVIVYLRQEGRGIGLLNKLLAYKLQDEGYDTVDANLMLGHRADERDYTVAAGILTDLAVRSPRLLTNNPLKVARLRQLGFAGLERVALCTAPTAENAAYLQAKATRMGHLIDEPHDLQEAGGQPPRAVRDIIADLRPEPRAAHMPFVTLAYAQSLDGSIAARRGAPTSLSSRQSLGMTHGLRANHDAVLVGIGTVLSDDPRLTVRLVDGENPIPVVLDSHLRTPPASRLIRERRARPVIATTRGADAVRQRALEDAGARVLAFPSDADGRVDLQQLLWHLAGEGIDSVMVEGGARVITSFLAHRLARRLVLTVAPVFVGGLSAVEALPAVNGAMPALGNLQSRMIGGDLVLFGDLQTGNAAAFSVGARASTSR